MDLPQEAGDGRDRTSELPTSILAFILSLLPLRTALRCVVLSKAWLAARQKFLSCATVLDFGVEFAAGFSREGYTAAVDRILAFHEAPNLDVINIFVGGREWPSDRTRRRVAEWVEYASSKQARKIGASFSSLCGHLPWRAFYSASLVCLRLHGCAIIPPLDPRELPSLQELSLEDVALVEIGVTESTIETLNNASYPNLTNVKLVNCRFLNNVRFLQNLTVKISLPRLRSLAMEGCHNVQRVEIKAPTLESLHLSFYKFVVLENVSGLKYVDIRLPQETLWENNLQIHWALISALQSVTTLQISDGHLPHALATIIEEGEVIPLKFVNLKSFGRKICYSRDDLMQLVNFLHFFDFPALEKLLIDYMLDPPYSLGQDDWEELCREDLEHSGFVLPKATHPFANLKEVILRGSPCAVLMKFVEFVLQRGVCLETLTLLVGTYSCDTSKRYSPASARNLHLLQRSLEALPKASPHAKILLRCSN